MVWYFIGVYIINRTSKNIANIAVWRYQISLLVLKKYRKIPKISPSLLYFSTALFEGLIFEGAYIQRGLSMEGN